MKILLIENDAITGNTIAELLRERGNDVVWVGGSGTPDVTRSAFAPGDGARMAVHLEDFELALIGKAGVNIGVPNVLLAEVLLKQHLTICVGIADAATNAAMAEFTMFSVDEPKPSEIDALLERAEGMVKSPFWYVPIKPGMPARRRLQEPDGYKSIMDWAALVEPDGYKSTMSNWPRALVSD